ncbi:MAG: hypothetical protein EWM72_02017 [Nitrospira sp.]|nr:MAG: hypothetical protein EWM72_02017 [Nitrospira sp.]
MLILDTLRREHQACQQFFMSITKFSMNSSSTGTLSISGHSTSVAELVVFQQKSPTECGRMNHKGRVAVSEPVGRPATMVRQSDAGGSFQLQQIRAGDHIIPDAAARVAPVPPAAKLFAEPDSGPVTMFKPGAFGSAGYPRRSVPVHVPP